MIPYAHTSAKMINQSSNPNFKFEILLAMHRIMTAIVATTVMIVMDATTSGPRFLPSHGTASVQMLRVEDKDADEKYTLAWCYWNGRNGSRVFLLF